MIKYSDCSYVIWIHFRINKTFTYAGVNINNKSVMSVCGQLRCSFTVAMHYTALIFIIILKLSFESGKENGGKRYRKSLIKYDRFNI